ncbi:expressed unknown protein [Seminavis robusta]|uniref:Uncharacterized protein n=1 Tax=Seminavis robusta TaxID=568900 RepID=A0A9N8HJ41_9STRA|nr:expressed unknown protein [Seminavis robusta]|eukprot:Sro739_g195440.1 n/a (868) ;mRNA; f:43467-46070
MTGARVTFEHLDIIRKYGADASSSPTAIPDMHAELKSADGGLGQLSPSQYAFLFNPLKEAIWFQRKGQFAIGSHQDWSLCKFYMAVKTNPSSLNYNFTFIDIDDMPGDDGTVHVLRTLGNRLSDDAANDWFHNTIDALYELLEIDATGSTDSARRDELLRKVHAFVVQGSRTCVQSAAPAPSPWSNAQLPEPPRFSFGVIAHVFMQLRQLGVAADPDLVDWASMNIPPEDAKLVWQSLSSRARLYLPQHAWWKVLYIIVHEVQPQLLRLNLHLLDKASVATYEDFCDECMEPPDQDTSKFYQCLLQIINRLHVVCLTTPPENRDSSILSSLDHMFFKLYPHLVQHIVDAPAAAPIDAPGEMPQAPKDAPPTISAVPAEEAAAPVPEVAVTPPTISARAMPPILAEEAVAPVPEEPPALLTPEPAPAPAPEPLPAAPEPEPVPAPAPAEPQAPENIPATAPAAAPVPEVPAEAPAPEPVMASPPILAPEAVETPSPAPAPTPDPVAPADPSPVPAPEPLPQAPAPAPAVAAPIPEQAAQPVETPVAAPVPAPQPAAAPVPAPQPAAAPVPAPRPAARRTASKPKRDKDIPTEIKTGPPQARQNADNYSMSDSLVELTKEENLLDLMQQAAAMCEQITVEKRTLVTKEKRMGRNLRSAQENVKALQSVNAQLLAENSDQKEEIYQREDEINQLHGEAKQAAKELSALDTLNSQLQAQIEELNKTIEALNADKSGLQKDLAESKKDTAGLRDDLSAAAKEKEVLLADIAAERDAKASVEKDLMTSKQEKGAVELKLRDTRRLLEEANEDIDRLEEIQAEQQRKEAEARKAAMEARRREFEAAEREAIESLQKAEDMRKTKSATRRSRAIG